MRYVPSREAARILGVHANSLRAWANAGTIHTKRTPGGQRLYDVDGFLQIGKTTRYVCYGRVSSQKQRDDLERQVEYLTHRYPTHEVITDIGSGLNFKRKGFISLLESICRGEVKELVVAHKDRLCRFGFDILSWLVEFYGGKLIDLNEISWSPKNEFIKDFISIFEIARKRGINVVEELKRHE
jgi:putative resolvase